MHRPEERDDQRLLTSRALRCATRTPIYRDDVAARSDGIEEQRPGEWSAGARKMEERRMTSRSKMAEGERPPGKRGLPTFLNI